MCGFRIILIWSNSDDHLFATKCARVVSVTSNPPCGMNLRHGDLPPDLGGAQADGLGRR
jgi:hypothetical protein